VHYERLPKDAAFGEIKNPEMEKQCVLSGGDDYELLFAAGRDQRGAIEAVARELAIALSPIGELNSESGKLTVLDRSGKPLSYRGGYDHFARS
jgi:thiamine-monophosphate kinase